MLLKLCVAAYCLGVIVGLVVLAISIRNAPYMDE
jgi:hypothetical protein